MRSTVLLASFAPMALGRGCESPELSPVEDTVEAENGGFIPEPDEEISTTADLHAEEEAEAEAAVTAIEEADLYAGHTDWCEWVHRPLCGKEKVWDREAKRKKWIDHGECGTDHRGVQMRCVRPYWASKKDPKVCASPFPAKGERDWRRSRLRFLVGKLYGLDGEWWRTVSTSHKAKYALRLYRLMVLIAERETSMRTWKAHNLGPDVEGASRAYRRAKKRKMYEGNRHFDGYRVLAGPGKREGEFTFEEIRFADRYKDAKTIGDELQESHPDWVVVVQDNSHRWKSFGYAGQTSAGWIFEVDTMAPPEALCLEAFSLETYVNRLRRIQERLPAMYDCNDADGKPYSRSKLRNGEQVRDRVKDTERQPTWHVLHRGASGGSMCPNQSAVWLQTHTGFARRARAHNLDPDQVVKARHFPPKKTPKELMTITDELNTEFCSTYAEWLNKEKTGTCS